MRLVKSVGIPAGISSNTPEGIRSLGNPSRLAPLPVPPALPTTSEIKPPILLSPVKPETIASMLFNKDVCSPAYFKIR